MINSAEEVEINMTIELTNQIIAQGVSPEE